MARGDREIRGVQSEWAMEGEQRKWRNVIKVEGRKNYRKQRNVLKRNGEKATYKYVDIIRGGIMELQ